VPGYRAKAVVAEDSKGGVNGANNLPTVTERGGTTFDDTDQPIQLLLDGATITFADLPATRLNVRAETSRRQSEASGLGLNAL